MENVGHKKLGKKFFNLASGCLFISLTAAFTWCQSECLRIPKPISFSMDWHGDLATSLWLHMFEFTCPNVPAELEVL